jgi:uncharacterized protein YqjF (DUF2071 family)
MMDRMALRRRPCGWPLLHQRWRDVVFFHWAYRPEDVRASVPAGLELDLHEGVAWISAVAFKISGMRPTLMPALPVLSEARQFNLRTYVHREGLPGLWFLSLDASNRLAVWGARIAYALPYHHARITTNEHDGSLSFLAVRTDSRDRVRFEAAWRTGQREATPQPGTLDSFLLDRYMLYAIRGDRSLSARIHHRPWPLRQAMLMEMSAAEILQAEGLRAPIERPVLHAQAEPFDVEIWAPARLD